MIYQAYLYLPHFMPQYDQYTINDLILVADYCKGLIYLFN